jgi:hypothetical protein
VVATVGLSGLVDQSLCAGEHLERPSYIETLHLWEHEDDDLARILVVGHETIIAAM